MKPLVLAAAVVAFELAFVASIATPPTSASEAVASLESEGTVRHDLERRAGEPIPGRSRGWR